MHNLSDELREREEKEMATAQTFATKEEAVKAAVEANRKTNDFTSVWKATGNNKYAVVTTILRESAVRLGYDEVVDVFEIGHMANAQHDKIKEV